MAKRQQTASVEQTAPVVEGTQPAVEEQEFKRCACGCGQIVNKKRSFAQGHDAKHRSNLLKFWDAGQGAMAEELVERGWSTWNELEARRAKAEAKADAKRVREAARSAKAGAKATAAKAKTESQAA